MYFKVVVFCVFIYLTSAQAFAGIDIDLSLLDNWKTEKALSYQGLYHFGISEGESSFYLIYAFNKWHAQIKYGSFTDDGLAWLWSFENLTNVKIDSNKFFSDQYYGTFVLFDDDTVKYKGLNRYETSKENSEIGVIVNTIENAYNTKYGQASYRELLPKELSIMSKLELKLMRNAIFARYGLIFKLNGDIDKFFKQQNWYQGQYNDVTNFLTEIEKENIKLIQKYENN